MTPILQDELLESRVVDSRKNLSLCFLSDLPVVMDGESLHYELPRTQLCSAGAGPKDLVERDWKFELQSKSSPLGATYNQGLSVDEGKTVTGNFW